MPYIAIEHMTGRTQAQKAAFGDRITAAAIAALATTPDRVRIVSRDVDPADLAGGGGTFVTPLISVEILKGRTLDQRRDFVRRVAAAVPETLGIPADTMRILFREMEQFEVARGGTLASDV